MGRQEGCGMEWVVAKLKQGSKITQIVEFRVTMMCTCTHKGQYSTTKALDRCTLTVGAISGPHS